VGWGENSFSTFVPADSEINDDARTAITKSGTFNFTDESFIGGPQVGVNYQTGNIVFGFQADVNFGIKQDRKKGPHVVPGSDGVVVLEVDKVDYDWLATFRPRIGIARGPWLFYVTGGVAVADVDVSKSFSWDFDDGCPQKAGLDECHVGGRSKTSAAGTIGGGFEWAFGRRLSLQAEYLFIDGFGDAKFTTFNRGSDFDPGDQTAEHKFESDNMQLIRIGLNWKFGGGHEATAMEAPPLK